MDVKDLHSQVEKMFEEKKLKKQKKDDDTNKIELEILGEMKKELDEMERKEEQRKAKTIRIKKQKKEVQTQTDSPKESKDAEIQTSRYDIDKESRKQKKKSIKESRELLEKNLEKKLEEKETPIKEKRKTISQIEEDIETHFEDSIEKMEGFVQNEAFVKNLESLTTEINKLLELKPSNKTQKKILNEETKKYFKDSILPILEKLDITEESLIKRFFSKKLSTSLAYGNLQALKRAIIKFQKEYRLVKPNIIEYESDMDIKPEK